MKAWPRNKATVEPAEDVDDDVRRCGTAHDVFDRRPAGAVLSQLTRPRDRSVPYFSVPSNKGAVL